MKTPEGKRRIPVVVYDRFTEDVLELSSKLQMVPNELVNRFTEGCLMQIRAEKLPGEPPPIVRHARRVLRLDLPPADRLIQRALESLIDGWADRTARWREILVEEVNTEPGPLIDEALKNAVKRAEQRWNDELKAERRRKKEAKLSSKNPSSEAKPTQN